MVYLHGGGFVVGGLHSHDDVCAEIRSRTGLAVVSVDYRLSPEHQHPAAFEDACSVVSVLPGPLVLVGDSAGGNLAAAAAHARRDPRILGQVLIYPGLGGDRQAGSYVTHANSPMLTTADLDFYGGCCQTNANQSPFAQSPPMSGRTELTPLGESGGAAGLEIVPAGEGAVSVEQVVD